MARPLVLIFQELASPQTTPATPDLNTVIVGPVFDIFDYPDDAATILLSSTYGELEMGAGNGTYTAYSPPAAGTDAITVLNDGYPGQSAGSRVDHASVKPWLRLPRVIMGSTHLSALVAPVFGGSVTTSALDRTLVTITGVAITNFVAAGIQPGDRVILTSSNVPVEQTVVRVVQSVGEPNAVGLVSAANVDKLRLTQELPDAGVAAGYWVYDASTEIRIERTVSTQPLLDPNSTLVTFPEPGTDKMVLKGGVTLPVLVTPVATDNTVPAQAPAVANLTLSYAEVYLPYRALRQDLQAVNAATADSITVVNGVSQITGLGKIDARNPLAVGVYVALQNAGAVPIYYFGVATDDAAGHLSARADMGSRRDLYCFVPLTTDLQIHAAYKAEFDQISEPSYAQQYGVVQKFRIVLGSVPLPVSRTIASGSISGVSSQPASVNTNNHRTLSIASTSTGSYPTNSVNVRDVLPGDSVTIGMISTSDSSWQTRRGTHVVGHVNSSVNYPNSGDPSALELIPGTTRWLDGSLSSLSSDIELLVIGADGNTKVSSLAQVDITDSGGSLRFLMKNPTVVGGPYTITYALNAALTAVGIAIAGFAVTITVNGTHTHTDVKNAIDAHPVLSTIMRAEVLGGATVAVDAASQATRDAVPGQTGLLPDTIAGAGAGNTRITSLTGMTLQSVGRYLELSGFTTTGYNGTFLIAAYVNPTTVDIVNATVLNVETGGAWTERYARTSVAVVSGSCTATIDKNDDLFNKLTDATAQFLTAGVLPGDVVEFPLDPNNYAPTAYDGRVLSYRVSTVQNENNLLIANGEDDTGSLAKELPHYFVRDFPDRWLDNSTPNALNYRVRRALSLDEQVSALVKTAQSVSSKRLTLMWPDLVEVADLRDGSLPRSIPSTRTLAGLQPSTYLACAVGGVVAGIPPQAGLTNGSFIGITRIVHSQGYFSEMQLSRVSDGGLFVCVQRTPGALPECIHQLTTSPTALETGELSVVKNVDFLSKFFQDILETFIGQYNVLPETMNEIYRAVSDGAQNLQSRRLARFGAPLISGTITSIGVSDFSADRIELFFRGTVARPLNTVAFHLVV